MSYKNRKEFQNKLRNNADVTGERIQELVEERRLKEILDGKLNKLEQSMYLNMKEEEKQVEEVIKLYEQLIREGIEYDEEDYQTQLHRLSRLREKQSEIERKNMEDPSWREFMEEELEDDEEEELE